MKKEFFENNRKKFLELMDDDSCALFFSGKAPKKTADEKYPYTPNRNFYYLTGIAEESVILFLSKKGDKTEEALFIHEYDEMKAKWFGETVSKEEALKISGIEDIRYITSWESFIHGVLSGGKFSELYLDLEKDSYSAPLALDTDKAVKLTESYPQVRIMDSYPMVCGLRVIKSPEEVEKIKEAIRITGEGIKNVWRNARPGVPEYEMEAEFDYVLKRNGVKDFAFTTICAGGINAACLHYVDNDTVVNDGEMLLLDLGAQYDYYNGDISRTFPINGKFSEEQRKYYDLVMLAHKNVFDAIKPGLPFKRLNEIVRETYAEELKKMGMIKEDSEVSKYYFHGVSHYLGLDTHDVGSRELNLQEGMVFTVEPGIYIPELNLGIRIEDDVLVTKDGMENLSEGIIREASDIEKFMAEENIYLNKK